MTVNSAYAQSVSGTASTTSCLGGGTITASSTGLGAAPEYQLILGANVIAPAPGDENVFTTSPVFSGLYKGDYILRARQAGFGTIYLSSVIRVDNNYTTMDVVAPTVTTLCANGTMAALTATVTGGKGPYTYVLKDQNNTTVIDAGITSVATSHTFSAQPVGSYLVNVTDACGSTVVAAGSVAQVSSVLSNYRPVATATVASPSNCALGYAVVLDAPKNESSDVDMEDADRANFTYQLEFNGVLYGDGGSGILVAGGPGIALPSGTNTLTFPVPAGISSIALLQASNPRIILEDGCGGTKAVNIDVQAFVNVYRVSCTNSDMSLVAWGSLLCYPATATFVNDADPSDTHTFTLTSGTQAISGLDLDATYTYTFVDGSGFTWVGSTTNLLMNSAFNVTQTALGNSFSREAFNYGKLSLTFSSHDDSTPFTFQVLASDNPLVAVGYTGSENPAPEAELHNPGTSSNPLLAYYWPKGNYTLRVTSPCGTTDVNVTVGGYYSTLSQGTTAAVCGGFNYTMNGVFDVPSEYEAIVVSGPSSVGLTQNLASSSASLPFQNLPYGTYTFGLRLKGGTTILLQETVTFTVDNVIVINQPQTGGYVCTAGSNSGVLYINAASNAPAPNNVLSYALSLDGGLTYGPYQSSNTFTGLTNQSYYYKITDLCGDEIIRQAQVGVATSPIAVADGIYTPASFCSKTSGTIQLDVDVVGAASYLWTGPGITAANQNLKNPVVNYSDMSSAAPNAYTCTVTFGAPCNSTGVASIDINLIKTNLVITNPAPQCTGGAVDLTAAAITAGSDAGLTYTYFTDAAGTIPLANPNAVTAAGTYYIKAVGLVCSTIEPVDVTFKTQLTAQISYPNASYCKNGTANVTLVGDGGGVYSSDAGLIIDPQTGTVDLSASTVGPHVVTYSYGASACGVPATTNITIETVQAPNASITALANCTNVNGTLEITPVAGMEYSIDGGATYSSTTSYQVPVGAYSIKARNASGCESAAATLTMTSTNNTPPTSISYGAASFNAVGTASVTVTGAQTGTYSALPAGLSINPTTGEINLAASTPNQTYIVTYNYAYGTCTGAVITTVTVNATATGISYPQAAYCARGTAAVQVSGVTGGTFSASPAGLVINAQTGELSLAASTPGTYTVTYSYVDGALPASVNTTVVVNPLTVMPVLANVLAECSVASIPAPTVNDACSGSVTASTNTVFPITTAGTTVVTWTFDYGSGYTQTVTQNVIIQDVTPPVAPVLANVTGVCSATVTAPTTTDNCNGVITGTTTNPLTYNTPGTYVVTWTFRDVAGNVTTATQNVIVQALAIPVVTVSAQPSCAVATGTINITPVSGLSYSVDGGGYSATTVYNLPSGNHTVTARNAQGCVSNAATVTINAQPALPVATINYVGSPFQATGTVSVSLTGQTGGTYSASPAGLSINPSTGEINLAASTPNQSYVVTYSFSNGNCSSTTSTTVQLNSTPASIVYPKNKFCAVGRETVVITGPKGGEFSANNPGLIIDKNTGTIDLSDSKPGNYLITYTYQDGSITSTAEFPIQVEALPVVNIDLGNTAEISKGDVLVIRASGGVSYEWVGPDIQSGKNSSDVTVRPRETTTYSVTVTNAAGCLDVASIKVIVNEDVKLIPNNVITPNGDGKNDVWVIQNIDYYPKNKVSIYDRAGRKVFGAVGYQNNWDGTYNGMLLAEDAYFYVIDLGNNLGLKRGSISIIRDSK
ncbi:gliding motility-associated C-terminal domain-containing protein [Pedobacter sp. MW01-1-1]|uniref:T9SS type B sorting domain-containing protein n=1 Tax=Pedobacter sp. MW01-1-1 TaxID=3383027 RepID=UPI003FED4EBA